MTGLSKYRRAKNEDRQEFLCKVKNTGDREQFTLAVIDELEDFVKSLIARYNRTMVVEYDDLMADFYKEVCEHIDDYDPAKYAPSTYFTMYINNAHREESKKGVPQYYLGKGTKLDKIAKEEGYAEGINDPNLSDITLAYLSKESLSTVKATRKIFSHSTCSFDEAINVEDILHDTPEEMCIKAEDENAIKQAFDSLEPFEKWLFIKTTLPKEEGGMTLKSALTILSKDYRRYGLESAPTLMSLKRTLAVARRKLRNNRIVKDTYTDFRDDTEEDDFQMIEDLNDSIAENIEELD